MQHSEETRSTERPPRVAFLTDTFHEVNGVALTSRQLRAFAERRNLPFLCVYGGDSFRKQQTGSVTQLQLHRGPLAFNLDKGLRHDPALWRHMRELSDAIGEFRADLIHITSPGDVGEMGAVLAHRLKTPLVISWHTNFHEFGARRLERMFGWLPNRARDFVGTVSERHIFTAMVKFYSLGCVLFAPNEELVAMLKEQTGKPTFLMKRGIDTVQFNPRRRSVHDAILRIGYVGRITPEKNVQLLIQLEQALLHAGLSGFRFLIVGDGSEREFLQRNLVSADLVGVLRGDELAEAYANMDVFVFPSKSDTFGNVVLEAMASGVPCVVTDQGGPKFIIEDGVSGFAASTDEEFFDRVAALIRSPALREEMGTAALRKALQASWDAVFDEVYAGYRFALEGSPKPSRLAY